VDSDHIRGARTGSGTPRLVLDAVGCCLLSDIAREILDPLDSYCTLHERDSDYAVRLYSSGWWQFLDAIPDRVDARRREDAAARCIETGEPVETDYGGDAWVLAVPIRDGQEIVGAVTAGYGASQAADGLIKRRMLSAARFLGEMVSRRRVETALAESERRFAAFMAHLPAVVFIKDDAGRLLFANRFLEELFGWKNCVGKTTAELLPPEIAESMMEDDLRVMEHGTAVIEERIVDAHGAERFFETCKFPIAAEGGRPLVGGISVETTQRRRTEEALRNSEAFLRTVIDQSPYPMWISDAQGTLVRSNQALRDLLHITDEQVVGKYNIFQDNLIEEQGLMPLVRRVYENGEVARFDIVWDSARLRGWGSEHRVLVILDVTIFPIRDAAGRVTHAVIQHVDITERTRAGEALRESERRYRDLLNNVHMVALMLDLEGKVTFCNHFLCTATGWSCDEVVGRGFAELTARDLSPGLLEQLMELARRDDRAVQPLEGAIVSRSGKPRWIQWSSALLRTPGGEVSGLACLGVDVTEHRVLQEQYLQAQKLESVGRLAGGVAHDFNNLLTVIGGYTNLALSEIGASDVARPYLEEVLRAADRAGTLTSQLLAFSRKQVIQPRPLDVNELVNAGLGMFERLVGEHIAVVTRLCAGPLWVMADPGQMQHALMNLVVNARDAMPDGGQLIFETEQVDLDSGFASMHPEVEAGPYVLLAISDTGIGMDRESLQHLFEPFFTTKAKGKGTGLGMPTVYGIVRQSRGCIYAYSEPGRGTVIKIFLPRIGEVDGRAEPARIRTGVVRGTGTVLVVEDQDQVRALAVAGLRSAGYRVLEADCGAAALQVAESYPGTIHMLLTDVIMPGMTGKELAGHLLALRPDTRVLYMSGYTEDVILKQGVLDPGVNYIPKPFTPTGLAARVAEVLNSRASQA